MASALAPQVMVPRIRRMITSSGRAADQRLLQERMSEGESMTTAVVGSEPMNAADAAWLHMDRPAGRSSRRPADIPGPGDLAVPPVPATGRRPGGHARALGRARMG